MLGLVVGFFDPSETYRAGRRGGGPWEGGDALGARATEGGDRGEEHQPKEQGKL
jgi:hypothetical protein